MRRRFRKIAKELFRRKVARVVLAYLSIFLAAVLATSELRDTLGYSDVVPRVLLAVGVLALPVIVFLAWRYDIVPPQLVRDVKDLQDQNPALSWARLRHDAGDAGYLLLSWAAADGSRIEKRFFQPVAIGREVSNDVEFADERVSRHHAVIWAENGAWNIRDLDSANGTYLGHARVSGSSVLPQVCDLRFHISGPTVSVQVAKAAETRIS